MPARPFAWTVSLAVLALLLLTLSLLWAGAIWQVPTLLFTTTATLVGVVLD